MRRALIGWALLAALVAPATSGQTGDTLTKRELIDRSGRICANLLDATAAHERRVERAADEGRARGVVRHGRRFIRAARPYVRRLGDLRAPASGRERYRTFVGETRVALNWLDAALDALAARRGRLATRRLETSDRHAARAERAARNYPLRRACIKFVD